MAKHITIMAITLFFIFALSSLAFCAEELTITTYYPSPYGSYNELTTTGNTYLATTASAEVGIGTTVPIAKLDVDNPAGTSHLMTVRIRNLNNVAGQSGLFVSTASNSSAANNYALNVQPGGLPGVYVRGDANVGIGTNTPNYRLHTAGTGRFDQTLGVGTNLDVGGNATVGGNLTVSGNINVTGNVNVDFVQSAQSGTSINPGVTAIASCPAGYVATGGGVSCWCSGGGGYSVVYASDPSTPSPAVPTAWFGGCSTVGTGCTRQSIVVRAVCGKF